MGNQDFPRCVNRRAGVELETSGQEEARDKGVQRRHFRGGGGLSFLVADEQFAGGLSPSDAYRVWFTAWCEIRSGRERHWFQFSHAFWLLSNDRSARSHGAGSSLRALSIGDVSLETFRF